VRGRPLHLGGIEIPFDRGLLGHSDGDVVLHALCDALLGAIGAGDIGVLFPDSDARYRGVESAALLRRVANLLKERARHVVNVDVTVLAERPRLAPHRAAMCTRVAGILAIDAARVSIKAKTCEGLGAIGRGEAMAAVAVALVGAD